MPDTITLSAESLALLRRRMDREYVAVTEENRPLYRELMAAGLVYPVSTFLHGAEGYYRPTEAACDLRDAGRLIGPASRIPSPAGSPSPRG